MKYKRFAFGMAALFLIAKSFYPRPEEFVRLDGVKSSIVFRNVESEISFDPGFYRGLREEDFDAETDILSLNQLRRLARFGARTLPEVFEAPRIVAEVKADFVTKHSLVVVRNIYPSARHTKVLVFIINKDASIIHRLGRYDAEASEIICNLAREDIDRFNAFIRKEGLQITDPGVALDVFRLFLTLARQREIQVVGERDEFLKGLGALVPGEKAVSDVPLEIGPPAYCRLGEIIRIKFSSYAVSGSTLSLDYWDVNVNKNGVIEPNSNESLVLQNPGRVLEETAEDGGFRYQSRLSPGCRSQIPRSGPGAFVPTQSASVLARELSRLSMDFAIFRSYSSPDQGSRRMRFRYFRI